MKRFDRTGLPAEHVVGGLSVPIEIHYTVDALFGGRGPLVTDMRTVVVIAKEDETGDKVQFAANTGVIEQDLNSPGITFRAFGNASALSILGDDNGLFWKRFVDLLEIMPQILRRTRRPAPVVFVTLDKIHQTTDVFFRRLLQGI